MSDNRRNRHGINRHVSTSMYTYQTCIHVYIHIYTYIYIHIYIHDTY